MNKSDMRFLKRWDKIRKRGFLLFLLRCEAFIFMGWFIGSFIGISLRNNTPPTITYLFIETYISLLGFLTGGLIGAPLGWYTNENRYKELEK